MIALNKIYPKIEYRPEFDIWNETPRFQTAQFSPCYHNFRCIYNKSKTFYTYICIDYHTSIQHLHNKHKFRATSCHRCHDVLVRSRCHPIPEHSQITRAVKPICQSRKRPAIDIELPTEPTSGCTFSSKKALLSPTTFPAGAYSQTRYHTCNWEPPAESPLLI